MRHTKAALAVATSLAIGLAAPALAQTGPVAAYAFDEGSGTAVADASGNNNNGTITGATWTTSGRNGNALLFNGSDSQVLVSASASLNVSTAMTLEAWVYPTGSQSGWRAIAQRAVEAYYLHASHDSGTLRPATGGTFGGVGNWTVAPSAIPVNTWPKPTTAARSGSM